MSADSPGSRPIRRVGLTVLEEQVGDGPLVRRRDWLHLRIRLWLHRGDLVRWTSPWGFVSHARLEDEGTTLVTALRYDRRSLIAGLFQGIDGMRVGGRRRLSIAPHLAYGERGVPGIIPANAVLTAEISVLQAGPSPSAGTG